MDVILMRWAQNLWRYVNIVRVDDETACVADIFRRPLVRRADPVALTLESPESKAFKEQSIGERIGQGIEAQWGTTCS